MSVNVTLGSNTVEVGTGLQPSGVYSLANLIADMPSAVQRLLVYARETEALALTDLIGSENADNNGCTFTAGVGFTGNGTSAYIDTNLRGNEYGSYDDFWYGIWVKDFGDLSALNANSSLNAYYDGFGGEKGVRVNHTIIGLTFSLSWDGEVSSGTLNMLESANAFPMFVAFQYDGTNAKLYINGSLIFSEAHTRLGSIDGADFAEMRLSSGIGFSSFTLSASLSGTAMTDAQNKAIYTALGYYLNRNNQQ